MVLNPSGQRNIKLNVSDGENPITDEEVTEEYKVSVNVKDGDSADPIKGAVVTFIDVTDDSLTFASGGTGSAGGCTVKAPSGSYRVTSTCEGYEDYVHPVDVVVPSDDTLVIEMVVSKGKGK